MVDSPAKTNSPPRAQSTPRKNENELFKISLLNFKICKQTQKISAISVNSVVHLTFLQQSEI
jgi:hypothetical protein